MSTSADEPTIPIAQLEKLRDPIHAMTGLVEVLQTLGLDGDAGEVTAMLHGTMLTVSSGFTEMLGQDSAAVPDDEAVRPPLGTGAADTPPAATVSEPRPSAPAMPNLPPPLEDSGESRAPSNSPAPSSPVRADGTRPTAPLDADPRAGYVLVVDDSPVNRLLTTSQLTKLGYDSREAESGAECLSTVEAERPALILLDWHMPEMNGLETARVLRRRQAASGWPHIPVIALTARAMRGDRAACLEAGMDDFLSKPIGLSDLSNALEQWLGVASDSALSAPPRQPTIPLFDAQFVADLAVDLEDEAAARSILETFLQELPKAATELAEAIDRGDRSTIVRVAHSLKSTTGMVGALQLRDAAIHLEEVAANSDDPVDGLVEGALVILERTRTEIELQLVASDQTHHLRRGFLLPGGQG